VYYYYYYYYYYKVKATFFPSHLADRAALISVSVTLSQSPAEAGRL